MNSVVLVFLIAGAANAWYLQDFMKPISRFTDPAGLFVETANTFTDMTSNMLDTALEVPQSILETATNMSSDMMQTAQNIFLTNTDKSAFCEVITDILDNFTDMASLPFEIMDTVMNMFPTMTPETFMNMTNLPVSFPTMPTFNSTQWRDMLSKMFNVNMNSAQNSCWSSVNTCNQSQIDPYVSFQLFTDTLGNNRTIDRRDATQCPSSNYTVKMIIPDYETFNPSDRWINKINVEYQRNGTYNIIAVNWTKPASQDYMQSAANTKCVGNTVAQFIQYLSTKCNISCNNIHIIGYGMGGHIAGFAGKAIKPLTSNACTVGRITSLDVSGPAFETCDCSGKLCKDDAKLVDNIHTDGNGLGTTTATGTADFYLNGGVAPQPGCSNPLCHHRFAVSFYTASIKNVTTLAYNCPTYFDYQMQRCKDVPTEIVGAGYTGTGPSGSYQATAGPEYANN